MTTGKALLGVLAGIAAGTVVGMLLAPDKESKLKKNISKKSENLVDALNERIDQRFEELIQSLEGRLKHPKDTN